VLILCLDLAVPASAFSDVYADHFDDARMRELREAEIKAEQGENRNKKASDLVSICRFDSWPQVDGVA
jgi:hypothetical protein